jgi:mycothiol synthase
VPPTPAGVDIRTFAVGTDEDAWVAINAAAFAHHPEQGSWTRVDLEARERDDWFDPSGFLMAWRGDDLLGFHWTKIHPDGAGEVYVIGVAPQAQGLGLGLVLLQRGLAYLREQGCPEVLLYVDGDNTGAMRLYERNGFRRHDLDVQWAAPGATPV